MDKAGSITYRSLVLWDCSYSSTRGPKEFIDPYIQTAHVVVLVIPKTARSLIQAAQQWLKSNSVSRVIVVITQADKIGESQITPNDIEILSTSMAKAVLETSISSPIDTLANIISANIP